MPVPQWYVLPDIAAYFRISLPQLWYALRYGRAAWYVRRWQAVEALRMACLAAAKGRPAPAHLPAGYERHGGPCDPEDSGIYTDEEDAA